ncbi:rCG50516, isoform CRA_a, partial [Rattus norvegicus]
MGLPGSCLPHPARPSTAGNIPLPVYRPTWSLNHCCRAGFVEPITRSEGPGDVGRSSLGSRIFKNSSC